MPTLSCNSVSAHAGNTYNSVWIQWNPHVHKPSRETLLQTLDHLPETVSLLLDTFRDTFSLYWKQKGPDGGCVKHQKVISYFLLPLFMLKLLSDTTCANCNMCLLQYPALLGHRAHLTSYINSVWEESTSKVWSSKQTVLPSHPDRPSVTCPGVQRRPSQGQINILFQILVFS